MSTAASASVSTNGIVVEVLNRENYSNWRALVKNYLMGKSLWYHIINDSDDDDDEEKQKKEKAKQEESDSDYDDDEEKQKEEKPEQKKGDSHDEEKEKKEKEKQEKEKEKRKKKKEKEKEKKEKAKKEEWEWKNRRALHAIQLSCGKALSQIKNCKTANKAWTHLKTSFSEDVEAQNFSAQTRGSSGEETMPQTLVRKGFLDDAKLSIDISYHDIFSASADGRTVLHVAVTEEHVDIVKQLAKMGKQRLLRMQDKKGYTALALAAKLTDNKEMAEWMVKYGGKELLTIAAKAEEDDDDNNEGVDEIPVLLASAKGNEEMTRYLFNHTPWTLLRQNRWKNGVVLLSRCIYNEIFDVAAAIIQHYDYSRPVPLSHDKKIFRPIYALAHMPSAFPSTGAKLNWWWQRFIYHNILREEDLNNENIKVVFQKPREIEGPYSIKNTLPGRLFERFQRLVQTRILLKIDVFQKIYKKKMNQYLVLEILKCLCKRISRFSEAELGEASAYDAMLQAAKNGITEIIDSMGAANPDLLSAMDGSKRGIFAHAILNRREEVFQLIDYIGNKGSIRSSEDVLGNNLLHIAAELGPPRYLDRISNAALQMQKELQWFQDVKNVVPRRCHDAKDASGKMASEVFSAEHNDLLKSAQQWAKDTASSFTLVGTLIITIMFAAAFTVPGGTDDKKGIPILLDKEKELFKFFIISDAVSLITSSSSVLMFIGILTSRYAEEDFQMTLPLKFLFGLVTLFLSVASMMCAFCAALALLLKGHYRIVIAAMWLALLPILVLVPSLLSLALEIFKSTVRFDKLAAKKKNNQINK